MKLPAIGRKEYQALDAAAQAMYEIHSEQCCTCNSWSSMKKGGNAYFRSELNEWRAMAKAAVNAYNRN